MGPILVLAGPPGAPDAARQALAAVLRDHAGTEMPAAASDRLLAALPADLGLRRAAISVRDGILAFRLMPGERFLPDEGPPADPGFEVLRSLAPDVTQRQGGIAVLSDAAPDRVAVLAGSATAAARAAEAVLRAFRKPETAGASSETVWEALGHPARMAQALRGQRHLVAAAIAWRGQGRIVGPLDPDRLLRFGVSAWR